MHPCGDQRGRRGRARGGMACPRVGSGSGERSGGDPGRDAAAVEPEPGGCRSEASCRRGGRAESVYSRATSGAALTSGRGTTRAWREGRRGGFGDTARERVRFPFRGSGGVRHRRHLREGGGLARSWRSGRTPREGGFPRVVSAAEYLSHAAVKGDGWAGCGDRDTRRRSRAGRQGRGPLPLMPYRARGRSRRLTCRSVRPRARCNTAAP